MFLHWLESASEPRVKRFVELVHAGGFDERAVHRAGLDAASPPLVHHLLEPPVAGWQLPPATSLLVPPDSPVLTLRVWPDRGDVCLKLLNASDDVVSATVGSGALRLSSAVRCDVLGAPLKNLGVEGDAIRLPMAPRGLATSRMSLVLM